MFLHRTKVYICLEIRNGIITICGNTTHDFPKRVSFTILVIHLRDNLGLQEDMSSNYVRPQ